MEGLKRMMGKIKGEGEQGKGGSGGDLIRHTCHEK